MKATNRIAMLALKSLARIASVYPAIRPRYAWAGSAEFLFIRQSDAPQDYRGTGRPAPMPGLGSKTELASTLTPCQDRLNSGSGQRAQGHTTALIRRTRRPAPGGDHEASSRCNPQADSSPANLLQDQKSKN